MEHIHTAADLDLQHEALENLLHRLKAIPEEPIAGERCSELLAAINMMLSRHIAAEEKLIRDAALPDGLARLHRDDHNRLIETLVNYDMAAMQKLQITAGELFEALFSACKAHQDAFDTQLHSVLAV